jgi:DNA-binding transcriptional MerR regulator
LPWEEGSDNIRSGHRNPDEFEKDSLRTITLSEKEGIKAVIGKPKGHDTTEVQSYLFDKNKWTLEKAKAWFEKHEGQRVREHVSVLSPFQIMQKITDKPLKIFGVATIAGLDRNDYDLTPEELQKFAEKLLGAPVYYEHVSAINAVGKVAKSEWDPDSNTLFYEAEIYDEETQQKIRKHLINHVSIGANYTRLDVLDGKVPHDLYNAELSLVAVPAVSGTNIQIMQKLEQQADQEFVLLPIRDVHGFLPDFFTLGWRDLAAGIQAIKGRLREKPETEEDFAFLFLKAKGWTREQAEVWVKEHAQTGPIGVQVSPASSIATESGSMEEKEIREKFEQFEEKLDRLGQHLQVPEKKTIPQILQSIDSKLTNLDKRLNKIERANEETEATVDLTAGEIKQKIADLTSQKAALTEKLEGATEEEKAQLQQQIDALDLEIQALEKALATKTAASTNEGEVEQKLGRAIIVPQEPEADDSATLKNLSLREVMEGQ